VQPTVHDADWKTLDTYDLTESGKSARSGGRVTPPFRRWVATWMAERCRRVHVTFGPNTYVGLAEGRSQSQNYAQIEYIQRSRVMSAEMKWAPEL